MPKIIVLSPKVSEDSAKNLATALGAEYKNPYDDNSRVFIEYDVVLKYGFSRSIKTKKGAIVLNKWKQTNKARDKIMVFKLLAKNNIMVPFTILGGVAHEWIKKGEIVVARANAKGANGKGLAYCKTEEDLNNSTAIFWTKYIEHTNEFRVNVWRDKVVSIYDKIRRDGVGHDEQIFDFKLFKGQENHPQLMNIVEKVWEKIGLDWCGLDILRTNTGELLLLEVNSAPILYPYTLRKLVSVIKKETK